MSELDTDIADSSIGPVVVIGAGLVGASIGCALVQAGEEVHLRDLVPAHAQVAASRGAGTLEPIDPEAVALVVVAVPPKVLADVVEAALAEFVNAVVTDVGSVKSGVLDELGRRDVDLFRYVGSHPMAGSQLVGPLSARPDLFIDRTWAITPHHRATPGAVQTVQMLIATCGAREVRMEAGEHDIAVAEVSHLPHVVSSLVAAGLAELPSEHVALAGQGVRDVTRIAASDPGLWSQILGANRSALGEQLGRLAARLRTFSDALADGDDVAPLLADGVTGTRTIPGKHGAAPVSYARFVAEIPDTPGALARLFADADAGGVNIEDISIEHDPVRRVGYLKLAVDPGQAEAFTSTMLKSGWEMTPDA